MLISKICNDITTFQNYAIKINTCNIKHINKAVLTCPQGVQRSASLEFWQGPRAWCTERSVLRAVCSAQHTWSTTLSDTPGGSPEWTVPGTPPHWPIEARHPLCCHRSQSIALRSVRFEYSNVFKILINYTVESTSMTADSLCFLFIKFLITHCS